MLLIFDRKQRVSAAFALLYLSFLTNAMYYGSTTEEPSKVVLLDVGFLPMDAMDMIIGFISNLIVFPPTILIVLLFKKSKALKKRKNRIDRGLEKAIENGRFKAPSDWGDQREETDFDRE